RTPPMRTAASCRSLPASSPGSAAIPGWRTWAVGSSSTDRIALGLAQVGSEVKDQTGSVSHEADRALPSLAGKLPDKLVEGAPRRISSRGLFIFSLPCFVLVGRLRRDLCIGLR